MISGDDAVGDDVDGDPSKDDRGGRRQEVGHGVVADDGQQEVGQEHRRSEDDGGHEAHGKAYEDVGHDDAFLSLHGAVVDDGAEDVVDNGVVSNGHVAFDEVDNVGVCNADEDGDSFSPFYF